MRKAVVLVFALLIPALASADGKMFARDRVLDIPFQRALIHHANGEQLLIVQSSFKGKADDLGWVIPCPSVPEVAALKTDEFFDRLAFTTRPVVGHYWKIVLTILVIAFGAWLSRYD